MIIAFNQSLVKEARDSNLLRQVSESMGVDKALVDYALKKGGQTKEALEQYTIDGKSQWLALIWANFEEDYGW